MAKIRRALINYTVYLKSNTKMQKELKRMVEKIIQETKKYGLETNLNEIKYHSAFFQFSSFTLSVTL